MWIWRVSNASLFLHVSTQRNSNLHSHPLTRLHHLAQQRALIAKHKAEEWHLILKNQKALMDLRFTWIPKTSLWDFNRAPFTSRSNVVHRTRDDIKHHWYKSIWDISTRHYLSVRLNVTLKIRTLVIAEPVSAFQSSEYREETSVAGHPTIRQSPDRNVTIDFITIQ